MKCHTLDVIVWFDRCMNSQKDDATAARKYNNNIYFITKALHIHFMLYSKKQKQN